MAKISDSMLRQIAQSLGKGITNPNTASFVDY